MENSKKMMSIGDILQALTIAVLFLVILLLVVFAARSYQYGADSQQQNDSRRALSAYVATAVKNHVEGEIRTEDYEGCPGISIEDGNTGYTHRIYLKDGELLEEYTRVDAPLKPDTATRIGETTRFDITYISDDLIEIQTDQGAAYVNVQR